MMAGKNSKEGRRLQHQRYLREKRRLERHDKSLERHDSTSLRMYCDDCGSVHEIDTEYMELSKNLANKVASAQMDGLLGDLGKGKDALFQGNVRDASQILFKRLCAWHYAGMAVMVTLMIIAGTWFSVIHPGTLKPDITFHPTLKAVSYYSNIPIKLGVVHSLLFGWELYHDPPSGERHVGQRLSTMWFQFFQHHRWGQHFHMQTETLLQVIDMLMRQKMEYCKPYPLGVNVGLAIVSLLMMLTNFITSCAYHTLSEQLVGALFTFVKLFLFDYLCHIETVNPRIGHSYTNLRVLFVGVVLVSLVLLIVYTLDAGSIVYHPTSLATLLFLGCQLAKRLGLGAGTSSLI